MSSKKNCWKRSRGSSIKQKIYWGGLEESVGDQRKKQEDRRRMFGVHGQKKNIKSSPKKTKSILGGDAKACLGSQGTGKNGGEDAQESRKKKSHEKEGARESRSPKTFKKNRTSRLHLKNANEGKKQLTRGKREGLRREAGSQKRAQTTFTQNLKEKPGIRGAWLGVIWDLKQEEKERSPLDENSAGGIKMKEVLKKEGNHNPWRTMNKNCCPRIPQQAPKRSGVSWARFFFFARKKEKKRKKGFRLPERKTKSRCKHGGFRN